MKLRALLFVTASAATICAFSPSAAQAVEIKGDVSFFGAYSPNNSDLSLATSVAFGGTFLASGTDDFAALPFFTPVVMAPTLTWDPGLVLANPLWKVGGFSFEMDSISVTAESSSAITLSGSGTVSGIGFDDTPGTWVATFNSNPNSVLQSPIFTWSSTSASVPDAGATLVLMGVALLGTSLVRRRA